MKFLLLICLTVLSAHAQIEFKKIDCKGKDDIACTNAQAEESKRLNLHNGQLFQAALKNCKPITTKLLYLETVQMVNEIHGLVDGKCKVTFIRGTTPIRQTCLFDKTAMDLMNKDPKTYTPKEQVLNQSLFTEQCKEEIIGDSPEAKEMRKLYELNMKNSAELQTKLEAHAIQEMNAEFGKLKKECTEGNQKSCKEFALSKKDIAEECKKKEREAFCKKLIIP